jgi:hypothetical protein
MRNMSEDVGAPIPGSRFVRDFCANCGEPMRICPDRVGEENYCSECEPPAPAHIGLCKRQRCGLRNTDGG